MDEAALSNGSSKSKRPKRNNEKSITYGPPPRGDVSVAEATSPVNSQGGVTSSSPDEVLLDENGDNNINRSLKDASQDEPTAAAAPPPPLTADPESPAVIDAEHHESECPPFDPTTMLTCMSFFSACWIRPGLFFVGSEKGLHSGVRCRWNSYET